MRTFFLSILVLGVLAACKKESKITETQDYEVDSAVVIPESNEPTENIFLAEYSPEQVSELVNKKNDTLYVTNFFATWCGPCMREIPHFKEKMEELKDQPVKFTFVSLDPKEDWPSKVTQFGTEHGLSNNIILLDGMTLTPDFFAANFKQWDGGSIPYTFMRKGDKTDETVGMMSKEDLNKKLTSF